MIHINGKHLRTWDKGTSLAIYPMKYFGILIKILQFWSALQAKIFWEKSRNQTELDNAEKLWYMFCAFLSASTKNLFLQGRLDTRMCPHAVSRHC